MAPIMSVLIVVFLAAAFNAQRADGLKYSSEATEVINKLRELMGTELYRDFMRTDDYLIKWLLVQKMDLQGAQTMLRNHLVWRKENRVDSILKEDFDMYPKMFEVTSNGRDKKGRPLFLVHFGAWDVRKVVVAGQAPKLQRYLVQQLESAAQKVREVNASSRSANITQTLFVLDGTGYNLRQHACVQCIPQYVTFLNTLESHYPFITSKIILINVPRIAEAVLSIVRPLLHPMTRKQFYVYGPDKDQWRKALGELIDEDQLPPRLGGTAAPS